MYSLFNSWPEIRALRIRYYLNMESKPKISKPLSSRLPDVFMQPRTVGVRQKKNSEYKNLPESVRPTAEEQSSQNQAPKTKKSRNPFLPIHQYMKLSKKLQQKMSEARQGIELDRFSKFSFDANSDLLNKGETGQSINTNVKYEDCLTLNVMKKNQSSCLKKILHVPTLTVYYLRESLIDFSIDKHDLEEWIKKVNSEAKSKESETVPLEIMKSYWNIPEGFYSIIYQYTDGTLFESALDAMNSFPISFIQSLSLSHLRAKYEIFNSQLIIKKNSQITYLPIYQEVDDLAPNCRHFRELMKIDEDEAEEQYNKIEEKLAAQLGFLVMISYFGDAIVREDISNVLFQSENDCCLIHKFMAQSNLSLVKTFLDVESNQQSDAKEKQYLIDFLCKTLKFKSKSRAMLNSLKGHRFLKTQFQDNICTMREIMTTLETGGISGSTRNNPSRQLSIHKFNKILDSMSLILQGAEEKPAVDLRLSNQNVKYLLSQFGFGHTEAELQASYNEFHRKLQKIYEN